jgi:hypothetical protein
MEKSNRQEQLDRPHNLSKAEARLIVDVVRYVFTFFTAPGCFDWTTAPLWAAVAFGAANAHVYARRRTPLPDVDALAGKLRALTPDAYLSIVRTVDQGYVDALTGARWPLKSNVEGAVAMMAGAMTSV